MSALTRYLVNTAQVKTGLGTSVIVGYFLQAAFGLIAVVLFLVALFFVFADYFAFGCVATSFGMFLGFAMLLAASMFYTASRPREGMYASLFGVATLLFAAIGVVVQLKDALNTVWGVENRKGGTWQFIRTYLVSFAGVISHGFLLLVSLLVSTALAAGSKYLAPYLPEGLLQIVTSAVSLGFITVLFAMTFKWLPETTVAWRDVWIGAAVTAVLFEIGKFAIGLYIGKQGMESTFGAAASLVVLLIWVYYSSQIVLMGAEFTRVCALRRGSLRFQTPPRAERQDQAAPAQSDSLRTFAHQSPYTLLVLSTLAGLVMSHPAVQRFLEAPRLQRDQRT